MSVVRSKSDVLTLLIHLGYLAYDWDADQCYIPNREVEDELVNAIKDNRWEHVVNALELSDQLLQAVLDGR